VTVEDVNKAARTAFEAKASVTGILLPEAKVQ
jgi:predicted Zn-dependent peptidase